MKHNTKLKDGLDKNFSFINFPEVAKCVDYFKNNEGILLIITDVTQSNDRVSIYHSLIAKEGKYLDLPVLIFSNDSAEENKKYFDEGVLEVFPTEGQEEIIFRCFETLSKVSLNIIALRDFYNNDVLGCFTYKGFIRDYNLYMKNSKPDDKYTLILCYVPTYLVLYYRYGMKYAVEMLTLVSKAIRENEDFLIVGSASEDIF